MGNLKEAMRRELRLRNYSPGTIKTYLQHMTEFTRHFGRSPSELGREDIINYLMHMTEERKVSATYRDQAVSALKMVEHVVQGVLPVLVGGLGQKVDDHLGVTCCLEDMADLVRVSRQNEILFE